MVSGAESQSTIAEMYKLEFADSGVRDVFVSKDGDVAVKTGGDLVAPVVVVFTRDYPRVRKLRLKRLMMQLCLDQPNQQIFPFSAIPKDLQSELRRTELRKHPEYAITDTTSFNVVPYVRMRVSYKGDSKEMQKGFGSATDFDGWKLTEGGMRPVTNPGVLALRKQAGSQLRASSEFAVNPGFLRGSRNLERNVILAVEKADEYFQKQSDKLLDEYRQTISKLDDYSSKRFGRMLDASKCKTFGDFLVTDPTEANEITQNFRDSGDALSPASEFKLKDVLNFGELETSLVFAIEYSEWRDATEKKRQPFNSAKLFQFAISD